MYGDTLSMDFISPIKKNSSIEDSFGMLASGEEPSMQEFYNTGLFLIATGIFIMFQINLLILWDYTAGISED